MTGRFARLARDLATAAPEPALTSVEAVDVDAGAAIGLEIVAAIRSGGQPTNLLAKAAELASGSSPNIAHGFMLGVQRAIEIGGAR